MPVLFNHEKSLKMKKMPHIYIYIYIYGGRHVFLPSGVNTAVMNAKLFEVEFGITKTVIISHCLIWNSSGYKSRLAIELKSFNLNPRTEKINAW